MRRYFFCVNFYITPAAHRMLSLHVASQHYGEFVAVRVTKPYGMQRVYCSLRAALSMQDVVVRPTTTYPPWWYRTSRITARTIKAAITVAESS